VLNERVFENDGEVVRVPLKLCVSASNEWPSPDSGKELTALLDRFLFRKSVRPITSQVGRQRLLWHRDHVPKLSTTVTATEVEQAHRHVNAVPWSKEAKEALETILRELAREGIAPGDRRQFKSVTAVQAFAFLCGVDEVRPEHLESRPVLPVG
jgi:MoxR-like ATPase